MSLQLRPTKHEFRFTEPVTIEIKVTNHVAQDLPIGGLSPSAGNVRFVIRKPTGEVFDYRPPVYKCEVEPRPLKQGKTVSHLTSLAVGAQGFTFDSPGRYLADRIY